MDDVRVYVPLEGEHFTAIDRATGATVWTQDIESDWPPLVHDGVVYLAASDELHALDAATGNHRWRAPVPRGAMAPMVMAGNVLIVLEAPDTVLAFAPNGGRFWTTPLGGTTGRASLAVGASSVFVGLDNRVVALWATNGEKRWDRTLPGEITSTSFARDRVFAGSTSNEIYALDAGNGELAWKFRVGGDVAGVTATDDHVFVVSLDNMARALSRRSGNQVWKRALSTRPAAAPQVFEGVVAVSGVESTATFNSRTGAPIGTFDAPTLLRGQPLVDATPRPFAVSIVAMTRDGRAIGLRPVEMMFREQAVQPLAVLPGRALVKEPSPLR